MSIDDQPLEYILPNSLSAWLVWVSTVLLGFILLYVTGFYSFIQEREADFYNYFTRETTDKRLIIKLPANVYEITTPFVYIKPMTATEQLVINLSVINSDGEEAQGAFVEFPYKEQFLNCSNPGVNGQCILENPTEGRLYFDFFIPKTTEKSFILIEIPGAFWNTPNDYCPRIPASPNSNSSKYLCVGFEVKYALNEAVIHLLNTPPWDNVILIFLSLFIVNVAERTVIKLPKFKQRTDPDHPDKSSNFAFTAYIWLLSVAIWASIALLVYLFVICNSHATSIATIILGLIIAYELLRMFIEKIKFEILKKNRAAKSIIFIWLLFSILTIILNKEENSLIYVIDIFILAVIILLFILLNKMNNPDEPVDKQSSSTTLSILLLLFLLYSTNNNLTKKSDKISDLSEDIPNTTAPENKGNKLSTGEDVNQPEQEVFEINEESLPPETSSSNHDGLNDTEIEDSSSGDMLTETPEDTK